MLKKVKLSYIWVTGVYIILIIILYLVVEYKIKYEDGSHDDVYGQYTYYTPVKTYRNHYTHKTFTIVCPKCNYSTGKIHKEDSVYRTRIDNKY